MLAETLEAAGFSVALQGQYQNVVALPTRWDGRPLTLIAAHYDSVPGSPGADDNASGLAVLLECARLASTMTATPAVGFVAFNAEEDGLLGSTDFVARGLGKLAGRIRVVHVLEMVGYRLRAARPRPLPIPWLSDEIARPDFLGLVGRGSANALVEAALASRAAPGLRLLTARTLGPLHWFLPDLARSDHFAFWRAGVPAVLWTDTGNFRNPNYHCATDTPDTLDYVFMSEVTQVLAALSELAGAPR